ncbi:MAG TPA: rod shape-determining protein MreD [Ignavibacteria bacterium]|nr:rod shape-determining protein MreD [Ignavibacteria bacterium]
MLINYLKYFVVLVILIFLQKSVVWLISISSYNITPDIIVIMIIYIGVKKGHIEGAIFGFIAGLILDFVSGSFVGLSALCYTISGFTAGYFHRPDDEKFLEKFNFLIVVFPVVLLCNMIYFLIFSQGVTLGFGDIFFKIILSSTTYTTLISLVFVFLPKRKETEKLA